MQPGFPGFILKKGGHCWPPLKLFNAVPDAYRLNRKNITLFTLALFVYGVVGPTSMNGNVRSGVALQIDGSIR